MSKRSLFFQSNCLKREQAIGANVAEAEQAQSRADFCSKMNITLKETAETKYWLRLLKASEYLTETEVASVMSNCVEIERILVSIVKSTKE